MTTPSQKTLKVSPETHGFVHDLAQKMGVSADEAIRHIMGISTVRVPVSTEQHNRWNAAARDAGVTVAQWITLRVEAALQYGDDQSTIHQTWETVVRIANHLKVER